MIEEVLSYLNVDVCSIIMNNDFNNSSLR